MKLTTTEMALTLIWKIAGNTSGGCVAIMKTLNDLIGDELYDQEMIEDAKLVAFGRCQALQIQESAETFVGEL